MESKKYENDSDMVKILSSNDEKLKYLGEILSNESSRKILDVLNNHDMSASMLSEKTGIRLSLVIHHLNKMQLVGIVKISKIGKNSKNHNVKYYSAKQGIMIFSESAAEKAKKSKTFLSVTKKILRFTSIVVASIASGIITSYSRSDNKELVTGSAEPTASFVSLEITIMLVVLVVGLAIERVYTYYKNRHSNHRYDFNN